MIKIFNDHQFCSGFMLSLRQVTVDLDVAYIMRREASTSSEHVISVCLNISLFHWASDSKVKPDRFPFFSFVPSCFSLAKLHLCAHITNDWNRRSQRTIIDIRPTGLKLFFFAGRTSHFFCSYINLKNTKVFKSNETRNEPMFNDCLPVLIM